MERYIDADRIVFWTRHISSNGKLNDTAVRKVAFYDEIARIPTADVILKSEYNEVLSNWQKIHDSYTTDCIDHYNKGRKEILEEIDRMCIDTFGNFNHRVFAELKKKYTEGTDG